MHWIANPQYIIWSIWAQNARRRFEKMKIELTVAQKIWGSELWFANTEDYCGKMLTVEYKKWSSGGRFHYHEIKDETFFVIEGKLLLDIASEDGEYQRITLKKYHPYRVMPGVKHRFSSGSKPVCKFIEASTHHEDSDSYRCYYDKTEGEWIYV